jgi:hypothetical protein
MTISRELLGTLATRGWRPYLMWSMSFVLFSLGMAFVYRFATGTIEAADFIALAGVVGPLIYGQHTRSTEIRAGVANAPSGGLVNPAALA